MFLNWVKLLACWSSYQLHSVSFVESLQSLGQGNVFTPVCQSFTLRGEGVCIMSLSFWLPGPKFLLGISVSGPMFLPGGLCQGDPPPPYGEEWAVCSLLECFLVLQFLVVHPVKLSLPSFFSFYDYLISLFFTGFPLFGTDKIPWYFHGFSRFF